MLAAEGNQENQLIKSGALYSYIKVFIQIPGLERGEGKSSHFLLESKIQIFSNTHFISC